MLCKRMLVLVAIALIATAGCKTKKKDPSRIVREQLQAELKPVALKNCKLVRYGSVNDGGYLQCQDLIKGVESAYSYGVEHEDNWGCQVSKEFGVPIHQYDCFTPDRPPCPEGKFDFHAECVGAKAETIEGRPYDSVTAQIEKNGDKGKRLLIKMDVEGAEFDSLMTTSDEVLERIDQLTIEMHGVNEPKAIPLLQKLKKTFHLVNVHYNNWECSKKKYAPLPGNVYEVLLVNKRLGVVDPAGTPHPPGAAPDAPNNPNAPDCQVFAAH